MLLNVNVKKCGGVCLVKKIDSIIDDTDIDNAYTKHYYNNIL